MREFLAIILARPSRNFDRGYLGDKISSKSYLRWNFASLRTAGIYCLKAAEICGFLYNFSASFTGLFAIFLKFKVAFAWSICGGILRLGGIYRAILNLEDRFKSCRGCGSRSKVSGFKFAKPFKFVKLLPAVPLFERSLRA